MIFHLNQQMLSLEDAGAFLDSLLNKSHMTLSKNNQAFDALLSLCPGKDSPQG
jgi:hypothetical protein